MNTFTLEYLDTTWHSVAGTVVMPLNIGKYLDERLDESQVMVYNDTKDKYTPNTAMRIVTTIGQEVKTFLFKVASDVSLEFPNGSGRYKHTIDLVELTKYLEGIVCQTITFTNVIPTQYAGIPIKPSDATNIENERNFESATIRSPLKFGANTIPSSATVGQEVVSYMNAEATGYTYGLLQSHDSDYTKMTINSVDYLWGDTATVNLSQSSLIVEYSIVVYQYVAGSTYYYTVWLKYQLPVVSTVPTKKWTIASVIDRIFDLCEPITISGEIPRFSLQASDHTALDKVLAPEFTMSQSTLREQLKVVGSKIHAEPRVLNVLWIPSRNRYEYTIGFDYYGRTNIANLPSPYLIKQTSRSIDQYITQIHTNPSNLVNSLQDKRGTITDPGADFYRSLRTEQSNIRVTDSNGLIQTAYPIYTVSKLIVGIYKYVDGSPVSVSVKLTPVDITAFLFESTEYDSVLTDYNESYPKSKAYAIRFKRGEKNIGNLFYQCPNPISSALSNYSIVKILSVVSGVAENTVQGYLNEVGSSIVAQVTYKPIFDSAFTHGKMRYDGSEPFTTVYNQSNGLVELSYFGENVKGVAERLGNPDIMVTAVYANYTAIPSIGDTVSVSGEDYAVASVNTEMTSHQIQATISITKDFNRISQYVGIDSQKRISQVSLDQSYNRDIIIKEYLVIGQKPSDYDATRRRMCIGDECASYYARIFAGGFPYDPISQAVFGYKNAPNDQLLNRVVLPVVASGVGNVTVLTASMKDNYSAGVNVNFIRSQGGLQQITGFWQEDVPYSDYYGRAKYIDFRMSPSIDTNVSTPRESAFSAPQAKSPYYEESPIMCGTVFGINKAYLARKDSRERFSTFNYCIEAKTTIPGLVIGSGISQMNALVTDATQNLHAKIYFVPYASEFPYKLDDTITDYDYTNWASADLAVTANAIDGTFYINQVTNPGAVQAQGWVIAIPPQTVTEEVDNDDGSVSTQTTYTYGNIILAEKGRIAVGGTVLGEQYTFRMERN